MFEGRSKRPRRDAVAETQDDERTNEMDTMRLIRIKI
jgi:hypothetical protein